MDESPAVGPSARLTHHTASEPRKKTSGWRGAGAGADTDANEVDTDAAS